MTKFEFGGPERFAHQRRGLQRLIENRGVGALLFDPGLGKTATVLDYASLLALKSESGEVRVLVVCPLAVMDTWVSQAAIFVSPQVDYWIEALGGSLLQRAEALASRGGFAYEHPLGFPTVVPSDPEEPLREDFVEAVEYAEAHKAWREECSYLERARVAGPTYARERASTHERAVHVGRAWAWSAHGRERERAITRREGPDRLGNPRLVVEVTNFDTLAYRTMVRMPKRGGGTRDVLMSDVMLDAIKRFSPDLIVVDESHKIKAADGHVSRLLARLTQSVKRRIILTGTVMPHGPLDVFAQWRFLAPYAFGDLLKDGSRRAATMGSFKSRYAVMGGWMGKEVIGYRNLDEMQKIMAEHAVVARKEDALDLPPTTDIIIPVHMSPAETKAYAELRDQSATQLNNGELASVTSRLTLMLRLRQITSGHIPDDLGRLTTVGTSKLDTIKSIVQDTLTGEHRIVIFVFFTEELRELAKGLRDRDTEVLVISGQTPKEDRVRLRRRFGSDDPQRMVMVAQIGTMNLGVNELVTANHAIFGSMSLQRDEYIQARDRLNRIGQTRPVTFWHAVVPGTVDEVILKSHQERTDLENAVLRHIQGEDENE